MREGASGGHLLWWRCALASRRRMRHQERVQCQRGSGSERCVRRPACRCRTPPARTGTRFRGALQRRVSKAGVFGERRQGCVATCGWWRLWRWRACDERVQYLQKRMSMRFLITEVGRYAYAQCVCNALHAIIAHRLQTKLLSEHAVSGGLTTGKLRHSCALENWS